MGWTIDELSRLEETCITALVKQASEGSTQAAAAALRLIEQTRKTQAGALHERTMAELDGPDLVKYLARLGLSVQEVERQIGRKVTNEEGAAWEVGQEERLLEVRAVELARMRRGEDDVPKWARVRLENKRW